ncbi:unnamed protein product [Amoebophrya sp. A120]|nr:unnamed protein product [Amoebophrya sp. A120]|eukprot:GSA120T00013874001.1
MISTPDMIGSLKFADCRRQQKMGNCLSQLKKSIACLFSHLIRDKALTRPFPEAM